MLIFRECVNKICNNTEFCYKLVFVTYSKYDPHDGNNTVLIQILYNISIIHFYGLLMNYFLEILFKYDKNVKYE